MRAESELRTLSPGDPPPPSLRRALRESRRWLVVAAALALVFGLLLAIVQSGAVTGNDRSLEVSVHRQLGLGTFPFFDMVSYLGGTWPRFVMAAVLVLFLLGTRRLWSAALVLLAQAGSTVGQGVKLLAHRPRPHLFRGAEHAAGYSFPSGHSLSAMVFFGAVVVIAWNLTRSRTVLVLAAAVAGACIVLIGLSRIVLGVHYPTDVLGGFVLGAAWLSLVTGLLRPWLEGEQ